MTDQGPRGLIPGQSMLRPKAPYGMTPGVRSVLPGINDGSETAWNRPPTPDQIDLDAPIANPPPPGAQPAAPLAPMATTAASAGWELTDPNGNTVHLRSAQHKERDAAEVQKLGAALMNHAVSEGDKATAARAMEWGAAQVGRAPISEITKQMAHFWDQGSMDDLKLELQGMRSKANRGGKGGVPNAEGAYGLPDPMSKFGHAVHKDLEALTSQIIREERGSAKYAAMSEHENQMAVMEQELNSGNAMAERSAVMRRLLEMTGKASRESEQAGITGSAGKWEELKNKLALWTSGNPSLSAAYVEKFKGMLASDRAAIRRMKEELGRQAATRALQQASRAYGPEAAQEAADTVYGAISGRYRGGTYKPPSDAEVTGYRQPSAPARRPTSAPKPAAPAPAPPAAGDNSDLYAP